MKKIRGVPVADSALAALRLMEPSLLTDSQPTTGRKMENRNLLAEMRAYLERYMVFPSPDYATVSALYCAATHLWPHFDAFPYLHITSHTKRSGKTRLSELLAFLAMNSRNIAGAGAATIYRRIEDEQPTLFMDEIEQLGSETASLMRTVLNVGYRRGQTIPKMGRGNEGIVEFSAYCPKVFIGIGDLFDTLRDRTIAVKLVRGTPPTRFVYDVAKTDGEKLRDAMHTLVRSKKDAILEAYTSTSLSFLSDRDEELWLPLFAVCEVLAPEAVEELKRIAVDMATEKTAVARRYVDLAENEEDAANDEYSERLLIDIHALIVASKRHYLLSADALDALKAIPIAPWRKFRGDGLTVIDMANLLSIHFVKPRNIKIAKNTVRRGYKKEDVARAIAALGTR